MEVVIFWIYVASFLDLFAVSLFIPLMSARLRELGASHFLMGCMTSVYALTQLVSGPVIGSWSDRIGRQQILFFSLISVSCCYTALGLIDSLVLILCFRAILGIFKHTQVLIRTIITDRVPGDQQTLVFGYLKAVAGVSFTIGPAIGGNLAELENGFSYICYIVGVFFLLNAAVVYFFLNDLPTPKSSMNSTATREAEKRKQEGSIMQAIRDLASVDWPIYWDIFALKFLMDFSTGAFHNNYSLKLRERFDLTPKAAGYTISLQSFVGVLAGLMVDKVNQRFYKQDHFYTERNLHGYTLMVIAYLGIAASQHISIFMVWSMLLRSIHMFLRIVMTEMTIRRCPPSQKGSIIGSSNSISNIARLMTPLITGYIEDLWGPNSSNLLAAAAATFGLLVPMTFRHQQQKIS
ncbi:major facilitator superfamily domain-containing protein 9-like [Venturia canescens]|uniref:major facilitator superfamily domain-containing protein 9-like n=1 Tax=Venturia canescens TaxID=32260 RepID=UPI001C9CCB9B|nr:major facilitator superfamily domain-containing protein 9-like [Venturia canescens]